MEIILDNFVRWLLGINPTNLGVIKTEIIYDFQHTALSIVKSYTYRGQDARTTIILLSKFVPHLSEICCNNSIQRTDN
ncbi:MAG: hypothetical protein F6K24_45230 [Okeania sp. SIO2D1]|nr:hypothetical protein [Okeania sp. SIO2D1]